MISVAHFFGLRSARAAALLAVLAFGWQGALPGPAVAAPQVAEPVQHEATVSRAELTPAHTILPAVPAEVAKPAPQQQRPYASIAAAAPSAESPAPPSFRFLRIADGSGAHPADQLLPPYSARGPPLLS